MALGDDVGGEVLESHGAVYDHRGMNTGGQREVIRPDTGAGVPGVEHDLVGERRASDCSR